MAAFAARFDYFAADLWVSHRLQTLDATAFDGALSWAERLSDFPLALIAWLGSVAILLLAQQRQAALLLLATVLIRPANILLKELVDRPRPSSQLVEVSRQPGDPSFPSGHTVAVVALYGFLFYLAGRLIRPLLLRMLAQAACVYVIAFTAMERIHRGHHWFSDIYGGALFAGLYLALLIRIWQKPRHLGQR